VDKAPGTDTSAHPDHPSGALRFHWAAATSPCGTFSIHHYRVVINEGSTPTSVTDGIAADPPLSGCSAGTCHADVWPHRSERTYYAKVFACQDAACSDIRGDAEDAPTNVTAGPVTTAQEEWVVTSIDPPDEDTGSTAETDGIFLGHGENAPFGFFVPEGWDDEGHLALYYDDISERTSTGIRRIKVQVADVEGWQDFNTASWGVTSTIAENRVEDEYDATGHAWPRPVVIDDVGTEIVLLHARNAHQPPDELNNHILQLQSLEKDVADFDMECEDCCLDSIDVGTDPDDGPCNWPENGPVVICADTTSGCWNLENAMQGTWLWDYVAFPMPNLYDSEPRILFSGEVYDFTPDTGDTAESSPCHSNMYDEPDQDNVYMAQWERDTGEEVGEWDVVMDGDCPETVINDAHGPAATPLPGDQFKIYSQRWEDGGFQIHYYKPLGGIETLTSTPKFLFDDSPTNTEITHNCIGNVQTVVYVEHPEEGPPIPHQGMFFMGAGTGEPLGELTCSGGFEQTGIYFAELSN
jgi:hypothetical protein